MCSLAMEFYRSCMNVPHYVLLNACHGNGEKLLVTNILFEFGIILYLLSYKQPLHQFENNENWFVKHSIIYLCANCNCTCCKWTYV